MSDTIDRQAAIDLLWQERERLDELMDEYLEVGMPIIRFNTKIERNRVEADVELLKSLPSAQPEIIACGDCKHWICHDRRCGYWNHGVKVLDWCSHAERRDEQDG